MKAMIKHIDTTEFEHIRRTLIEFMDNLRDYVRESGTNIASDDRDSSEFVDIFIGDKINEILK